MRAIAVAQLGASPELMDLPRPTPGPGELLVRLGAAGVNPFDAKIAEGVVLAHRPHVFPLVLGVDGAGVVEAVGPNVTRFQVGDAIYGSFLHDPVGTGTYCELATVPETNGIAPIPRGIYTVQAASVPTAGMTARQSLDELALTKGQTLLILGASGGVGSFATQLAAMEGIHVIVGARGPNRDFLRKLGAIEFFDTATGHLVEEMKFAHPGGIDAILDVMNSGPAFDLQLPLLREGGVVASTIGAAAGPALAARKLRGLNIDMRPTQELLGRLSKEMAAGRLRTPVESQVPLAEGVSALERLRAGQGRGKIVLTI